MKKCLLLNLLLLLMLPILQTSLKAQYIITSKNNMPRIGDELEMQRTTYTPPGMGGENVCWNFSNVHVLDRHYRVYYTCDSDSVIIRNDQNTMLKNTLSNDSLMGSSKN